MLSYQIILVQVLDVQQLLCQPKVLRVIILCKVPLKREATTIQHHLNLKSTILLPEHLGVQKLLIYLKRFPDQHFLDFMDRNQIAKRYVRRYILMYFAQESVVSDRVLAKASFQGFQGSMARLQFQENLPVVRQTSQVPGRGQGLRGSCPGAWVCSGRFHGLNIDSQ